MGRVLAVKLNYFLLVLVMLASTISVTSFGLSFLGKVVALGFQLVVFVILLQGGIRFSFGEFCFACFLFLIICVGAFNHEKIVLTVLKGIQYSIFYLILRVFSKNIFISAVSVRFLIVSIVMSFLFLFFVFNFGNIGLENRFKGWFFDSNYWGLFLVMCFFGIDICSSRGLLVEKLLIVLGIFFSFSLTAYVVLAVYFLLRQFRLSSCAVTVLLFLSVFGPPILVIASYDVLSSQALVSIGSGSDISVFVKYKFLSAATRLSVNLVVISLVLESFQDLMFGYGYGVVFDYLPRATHTVVFQVLFSSGLLGVLGLFLLLVTFYRSATKSSDDRRVSAALCSFLPVLYSLDFVFSGLILIFALFLSWRCTDLFFGLRRP
jgi:hypothetical protein